MNRKQFFLSIALACAALAPVTTFAQAFPSKQITIIVPASPGGAIDLAARLIGQKLTEAWGQSVVVDNKAGATGIIGTDFVAKAAPDGHTLALVASSHAINPSMVKKLPFDTVKSFEPVVLTHVVPLVLVVAPSLPVKSVKELIAYGKANPGKLTFASSGSGGAPHFSGELFKTMAGIDMTHVPYKGSTLAHPDLLSGRTSMMFDTVAAIKTQIGAGNVRALAVTQWRRPVCRATRRAPGAASSRLRALRRPPSPNSIPRSTGFSRCPTYARSSKTLGLRSAVVHRSSSVISSAPK